MKVKELIKELQQCNPEASVTIVVGDEDKDYIDTPYFELHHTDADADEAIDIFIFTEKVLHDKDMNELQDFCAGSVGESEVDEEVK